MTEQVKMTLTKLAIKNFKGIRDVTIDNLQQFNLFIGPNNSGKSSILEAIYSFQPLVQGAANQLVHIFSRRAARPTWSSRELLFLHESGHLPEVDIRIGDEDIKFSVQTDFSFDTFSLTLSTTSGFRVYQLNRGFGLNSSTGRNVSEILSEKTFKILSSIVFFDPRYNLFKFDYESLLSQLPELSTLGDIYEEVFVGSQFDTYDSGSRRASLKRKDGRSIFLDSLGDGHRSGYVLVNLARSLKDKVILIEEIETGQHPASLRKLIPLLLGICRENGIQIFATTHSPDAFKAFSDEGDAHLYYVSRGIGDPDTTTINRVEKDSLRVLLDMVSISLTFSGLKSLFWSRGNRMQR